MNIAERCSSRYVNIDTRGIIVDGKNYGSILDERLIYWGDSRRSAPDMTLIAGVGALLQR